jgi:hypothetical protein
MKAFVQGATAAATGAITGSVVILAQRSIVDVPTAAIGLLSFGVLWRFKLHEPIVVGAAWPGCTRVPKKSWLRDTWGCAGGAGPEVYGHPGELREGGHWSAATDRRV